MTLFFSGFAAALIKLAASAASRMTKIQGNPATRPRPGLLGGCASRRLADNLDILLNPEAVLAFDLLAGSLTQTLVIKHRRERSET